MWTNALSKTRRRSRVGKTEECGAKFPGQPPVGYLAHGKGGLVGSQGTHYDYVLGSEGLYVQAKGRDLACRILVAPANIHGLTLVDEKLELPHGPIPGSLFEAGFRWFQTAPHRERFFHICWDGRAYRLLVPEQDGEAASVTYTRAKGVLCEVHSHGPMRAFFSPEDDNDEDGFRVYGVLGRLDGADPELALRVGVYGHFGRLDWGQVFSGPSPRVTVEGPTSNNSTFGG